MTDTLASQFLLDPDVVFLNHGSFGATPQPVFAEYQRLQLQMERQPVLWLGRLADELLGAARKVRCRHPQAAAVRRLPGGSSRAPLA